MNAKPAYPLTYGPAYIGLFVALYLAAICNAFLDIQYRTFRFEAIFWGLLFAFGLWLGWRQQGEPSAGGRRAHKWLLVIGLLMTLLVFIRLWGFPRAGLALLLVLQAAQNCICVSRRQLYLGLLVSLVAVVFAASHFRADWTMLFYLLPYVVAVVFTLVAEQINRRASEIRRDSHSLGAGGGQSAAIVFATLIILGTGGLLYAVTPQPTWHSLYWKYGQPGNVGLLAGLNGVEQGQQPGGNAGGGPGPGEQQSGGGSVGSAAGLSIGDMREAARRPGMPQWQAASINAMADGLESLGKVLQPVLLELEDWWEAFKQWLEDNRQVIGLTLMALLALALLLAFWKLIRELRLVVWLRVQLDYLHLVRFSRTAQGNRAAIAYYRAAQRLFDLHELECPPAANTREYLQQVSMQFRHLGSEAKSLSMLFEQARYGEVPLSTGELQSMRQSYQRIFQRIDVLNALDA